MAEEGQFPPVRLRRVSGVELPPVVNNRPIRPSGGSGYAVPLQLHALAYNLANFLRRLALPKSVAHWSLTTLKEKLIKIGAKIVRHARYVTFQMAEVAIPRTLFREILRRIARLKTKRLSLAPG